MTAVADRDDVQHIVDRYELAVAEQISSLLAQWHVWSAGFAVTNGYPAINATCRTARSSRQYDDANGSLDAHVDHLLMEAMDAVMDGIAQPWRTALCVQARNLATGYGVWSSPRLPACPLARAELLCAARNKLRDDLIKADLL